MHYVIMAFAPAIALPIFLRFGLYRAVIRYLPERFIWTIVKAMALATLAVAVRAVRRRGDAGRGDAALDPAVLFPARDGGGGRCAVCGQAGAVGAAAERIVRRDDPHLRRRGCGRHELATALRTQGGGFVAGFVDDDESLQGRDVMGLRVYPPAMIEELIRDLGVSEIILSVTSIDTRTAAGDHRRARPSCRSRSGRCRRSARSPSGKYSVSQLREIDIDDLLGRSSVPSDPELLRPMIEGRVIMVTGGGGSIGSELCRIVVRVGAQDADRARGERVRALPDRAGAAKARGDDRSGAGLGRRRPAGAAGDRRAQGRGHLPRGGAQARAAGRGQSDRGRAQQCLRARGPWPRRRSRAGCKNFILVSTDKAVRPPNVMGASKRWAELVVREIAERGGRTGAGQRFCAVRFGNVLGSTGSVVPLFREQIAGGGPVTLTDERMTRYFMSIHEAAELIVQAGDAERGRRPVPARHGRAGADPRSGART